MLSKIIMFPLAIVTLVASNWVHADIAGMPSAGISAGAYASGYVGLGGSGYYGGTQGCGYQTRTSRAAVDVSDEEKRERKEIKKLEAEVKSKELERDRAKSKLDLSTKRIERYFDSEIAEFLMGTHMDKLNLCEHYRTYPDHKCPDRLISAATADASGTPASDQTIATCKGLDEVPKLLKDTWTKADGTGYCSANSKGARGAVSSAICNDKTLIPQDAPKSRRLQPRECSTALADYRKAKIEYDNAQDLVDRKKEEIEDRTLAVADARERAKIEREYKMKTQLEGDCEECEAYERGGRYERPKRDWWSTAANVVGGLGLMWYGKKIDESAQEYNAQLGFPSNNSYGYPFVTAGAYGVINGLVGPGAYGCAGGVNGSGFPYGASGAYGPYGANGYGPFGAQGGAFGYPQGMYGSPWGGGMYLPGFGGNGMMAGPNGGWPYGLNGGFGIGTPLNGMVGGLAGGMAGGIPGGGGMALCITWPCQPGVGSLAGGIAGGLAGGGWQMGGWQMGGQLGGMAQIGIPASGGIQGGGWQLGGQLGGPLGGLINGGAIATGSYLNNGQYQQQLMQQQQMMLQQQMQQQQMAMQYYQAQAQAQMQAYQRQVVVAQQAQQVQTEIYSLQMRLQMLLSGSGTYSGGGAGGLYGGGGAGLFGGGIVSGGGIASGGFYFGAQVPGMPYGSQATIPGIGSALPASGTLPGSVIPGTGGGRGR